MGPLRYRATARTKRRHPPPHPPSRSKKNKKLVPKVIDRSQQMIPYYTPFTGKKVFFSGNIVRHYVQRVKIVQGKFFFRGTPVSGTVNYFFLLCNPQSLNLFSKKDMLPVCTKDRYIDSLH